MKRLILALALPLAAQDLCLVPGEFVVSPGQRITVALRGADAHPARLRDAALYAPKGVYNVVNLHQEGGAVVGEAAVPAKGTLILTARAAPEIVSRERRASYAKALLVSETADDHFRRVTGLAFEFIPEADPHRLRPGGRLPVRLLLEGEPAAGIEVEASRDGGEAQVAGRTDTAGRIQIPIAAAGKWRLRALVRRRCAEPQAADWESFSTSLTFAVPDGSGAGAP